MALPENYVIKAVSSVEEFRSTITKWETEEGWTPAIDDPELFYNCDNTGFFVGWLDGKPISCISMVKYGDAFAFLGTFIVLKEYRKNGYGVPLFKKAMESVPPTCNVGLDSVPNMEVVYRKWGFVETYKNCRVQIDVAANYATLEKHKIPPGVCIEPARNVNFDKLSAYDTSAFGAPHHLFLKGLLDGPNTITLAATNSAGDIVGFVAARKTVLEAEGWKVAPMYADNGEIVRVMLGKVLLQMKTDSPQRKVCMLELAVDLHPDTAALAKELNAVELLPLNRMLTKGPLQFTKEKVYSYGAGELG